MTALSPKLKRKIFVFYHEENALGFSVRCAHCEGLNRRFFLILGEAGRSYDASWGRRTVGSSQELPRAISPLEGADHRFNAALITAGVKLGSRQSGPKEREREA